MLKVALISLGCPKNLVDSENMLALLSDSNFDIVNNPENADIIIINTCGFINSAKEESIMKILEMVELKETGKCQGLIVTGCLVQKYYKELRTEIPEIDAFIGTNNFHQIVDVISQISKTKNGEKIIKVNKEHMKNYYELPRKVFMPTHFAYVRIAEGCDNRCTYCVIPEMRGPFRSRYKENIINEVKDLVKKNIKEIILVAQDTTQYGKDIYGKFALPDLLKELVKISELRWIRLLYCYPNYFTDDLIELIKSEPKICNYVDIPLQHADNNILRKMGRNITQNEIRNLIYKLKENIPEIKIRSTFIVGFPGETEENYRNLLRFLKEVQLDYVGAFTYSKEENTPAAKMSGHIPEKIKEKRLKKLMELQYTILREKNSKLIGKEIKVQVDEPFFEDQNLWICRSEGETPEIDPYILVFSEKKLCPGQFLSVRITHFHDYDLIGEIICELT